MSSDNLVTAWESLGIAFNIKNRKLNANPEKTIIDTILSDEFPGDRKMFELMLLWLHHYHDLVHVDRLKSHLAKLNPFHLALIGGLATKCLNLSDFRWEAILTTVNKKLGKNRPTFSGDDPLYLKMKGVDKDFAGFGIKVAPVRPDNQKKLMQRKEIIKNNTWLKNRLLFGVNLRADFVTVFALGLAENAYQAAKLLNCSANASYRNWGDLEEARSLDLL